MKRKINKTNLREAFKNINVSKSLEKRILDNIDSIKNINIKDKN